MDINLKNIIIDVLDLTEEQFCNIDKDEDLRKYALDSMNAIQIIVEIEDLLEVEVKDEDLLIENVKTINRILELYAKYNVEGKNLLIVP